MRYSNLIDEDKKIKIDDNFSKYNFDQLKSLTSEE